MLALSDSYGFPLWEAWGNHFRGYKLTLDGSPQEGIELISKYSAGIDMAGMVTYRPFRLMLLAEAYRVSGQLEEGLKRINEAAKVIEMTQERVLSSEVHRTRGDLLVGLIAQLQSKVITLLSRLRVSSRQSRGNSAPPLALRGSGATRASATRLAIFLLRSTAGLQKGLIRAI